MDEHENRTELKVGFKKLAPTKAEYSVGYLFYQPERDTVLLKKGVMGVVVQTTASAPTNEDFSQVLINGIKENYYKTPFTMPTEEAIKQAVTISVNDFYTSQTKLGVAFSLSLIVITKDVAYFMRKYSGMIITQRLENIRIQASSQSEEDEDPRTITEDSLLVTIEKMKAGDRYLIASEDTSYWLPHEKLRDFIKSQPPQVVSDELVSVIRPVCDYGFATLVVMVDKVEELDLGSSSRVDLLDFLKNHGHYIAILVLILFVVVFVAIKTFFPSVTKSNRYTPSEKIIPSITETPRMARDSLAKVPEDIDEKKADTTSSTGDKTKVAPLLKKNTLEVTRERIEEAFRKGKSTLKKGKLVSPESIAFVRVILYHQVGDYLIMGGESNKDEYLPMPNKNKPLVLSQTHLSCNNYNIFILLPDGTEKYRITLPDNQDEFKLSQYLRKKKSKLKKLRLLVFKTEQMGKSILKRDTDIINVSENRTFSLSTITEFQKIEPKDYESYLQLGGYMREASSSRVAISGKIPLPNESNQQ